MKAYSTKYALTFGIEEINGKVILGSYFEYGDHGFLGPKDWHRTRESAVARAEEMRAAKIASLRKQIAKLEAMRFGEEPKT